MARRASAEAVKAVERMSRTDRERVLAVIRQLPTAGDIVHLKGTDGYRLRVREWRILLRRNPTLRLVTGSDVRPRGSAYKP